MPNLGIGIIGCGNISAACLRLAPLFNGVQVRGVADVNMATATARGAEFGVKSQSVDDLPANPEVDASGLRTCAGTIAVRGRGRIRRVTALTGQTCWNGNRIGG
jgi:hypothetical protein